ncbi:MAG: C4-dicarboxylate ABC transporter substrate-binding protein [Burkholderiales bacterium]|nr:C4-dicarboxylate ABC transporter substrate-binding protein [Burkholderiales bacterium]
MFRKGSRFIVRAVFEAGLLLATLGAAAQATTPRAPQGATPQGTSPATPRPTAQAAPPSPAASAATRPAGAPVAYKIVTASERGTYIQIGRDLGKFIAPQAQIDLEALPSAGSPDNIHRLRYEEGVKLALVQSDVYQAFINQGRAGDKTADAIIRPLRVVLPLYNEEVYFVVRADSPMNFVHEMRDARINVGPMRSGTAMTTTTMYRLMFDQALPDSKLTFLTHEEALFKLTGDKSIDVVAIVAGQPAKLLTDMKAEARSLIKLLKLDPDNPASKAALKTYFQSAVKATNYPNLLTEDLPGMAVKAFLVTYDYNLAGTQARLAQFARSLCLNFDNLQSQGHPKWKEVSLDMPPLGQGWTYYPATARELGRCAAMRPPPKPVRVCTTEQKILGLCD